MSEAFKKSYLIPSPSQISELREIIRSHSPPSATLLSRSQNMLEETVAELRSEKALLESYADNCRSLFSPARRLPTELLVEIFDLCSPEFNSVEDTTTVKQEETGLAKYIFFRSPGYVLSWFEFEPLTHLFGEVDTTLWNESAMSSATLVALLASSLNRGANFPLTLEAAMIDSDHSSRNSSHKSVGELLAQHSYRWQTVYLWVDPSQLMFLGHARGNLPLLETLTLISPHTAVGPTVEVFTVAPRLKTAVHGFASSPPLPRGQLLQLTIGRSHAVT
ncbi:hypothetical protein B0H16DRAFT_1463099 [Mycena metata]|uniref:Uncharacterized protein n=1 Tax=Mycena metata TaxID=1033252 RepID=A0AAD7IL08_9AGAR|nr:hypothetical protein B0H16DRAFT_1463099 [Mycena metata]